MSWATEYDCGKSIYMNDVFFYIIEGAIMINIYRKKLPHQYIKKRKLCIV